MHFGQNFALYVSKNMPIVYDDPNTGFLNYTVTINQNQDTIYGNSKYMVQVKNGQMPVREHDRKFRIDDWAYTVSFGVGCATFYKPENNTELFVSMAWEAKNF